MKKWFIAFVVFSFQYTFADILNGGAVSSAAGGTGRASVDAGTPSLLNPAMLVHLKGRQIYTAYEKDTLVVGLSENSKEVAIPTSISYWQKKPQVATTQDEVLTQDFRLTVAEFIQRLWAVGVTAHYFQVRTPEKTLGQGNIDLGFSVTPVPDIGMALVFYNLGQENKDIADEHRLYQQVGIGFNHIYRDYFRSRLDILSGRNQNFSESTLMLGIESYMNQWTIIRLGYLQNTFLRRSGWTAGFGFDLPKFRINYAYQSLTQEENRHSVDMAIPF